MIHTYYSKVGISRLLSLIVLVIFIFVVSNPRAFAAQSTTIRDRRVVSGEMYSALKGMPGLFSESDNTSTSPSNNSIMTSVSSNAAIDVPKKASNGVQIRNKSNVAFNISLPNASQSGSAKQIASGIVGYESNNGSANAIQADESGGVRMLTIIDNVSAPESYGYKITIPQGGSVKILDNGGAVISSSAGAILAFVAKPWAKDAKRRAVATWFSSDGRTLIQHVNHAGPGVIYPVVADPWFGIKLISSVSWSGNTLRVYPTTWARYWAGPEARGTAWNGIVRLASRANKPTMRDQFYCHWDLVRLRASNKPSWNLDLNRPDVGYWTMVKKQCNP